MLSTFSSLQLAPATIVSTWKVLGPGLAAAAAPARGAAVAAMPSFPASERWTRGFAVYAPGGHPKTIEHSAAESAQQPHELQFPAPPVTLKAGGSFAAGAVEPHPGIKVDNIAPKFMESHMPHPAYTMAYLESVRPTHQKPNKLHQQFGHSAVQIVRALFDSATGYTPTAPMSEAKWLQRIVFLETVAGVPGMVGGMLRHHKSLRTMKRDHGWIHTLLEEAENERMHLITFLELRRPGPLFRAAVIAAQGVFFNAYFLAYLVSPSTCHAFVGFLEEQAVRTYTHALAEIDAGRLWPDKPAPAVAVQYWGLPKDAKMQDLILAVRADEACHAHVNHTFSMLPTNQTNPFATGASQLP